MDPMGTQKGVATQQAQRAATPMPINAQSMQQKYYNNIFTSGDLRSTTESSTT